MRSDTAATGIFLFALGAVVVSIGYGLQASTPVPEGPAMAFYYPLAYLATLTQMGGWLATGAGALVATYGTIGKSQQSF
ncbi:MAG: hypothetical protein HY247_02950 [archaeon]|nr:MAG: hypothetical protein HY247_02950 [archaeon]